MEDKGRSFFDISDVHRVCACKDVTEARRLALDAIERFPSATKENIFKARVAVSKATTVKQLGITITNFMLAHPSEGLKTVKHSQVFRRKPAGQEGVEIEGGDHES